MMELNSFGNVMNRFVTNNGAGSLRGQNVYIDGFDGIGLRSSLSEGDLLSQDELLLNQARPEITNQGVPSEGMIVDLVRTLTSSLTRVIDLVQGALLGNGVDTQSQSSNSMLGQSRDARAAEPAQGLFGALGSIAGNMVDKVFMQIPLLGGRGL